MDMSLSIEEKKEKDYEQHSLLSTKPKYPYGLRLCLDPLVLKKLGFKGVPEMGQELKIKAVAEIVSIRDENNTEADAPQYYVDLQIKDMDFVEDKKSAEDIMYGDK